MTTNRKHVSTTVTSSSFHPLPEGARFVVSYGGRYTDCGTTIQTFAGQRQAEAFARRTMVYARRTLGMRLRRQTAADGYLIAEPSLWALIYAVPSRDLGRPATLHDCLCYRSVDPGGIVVKDHTIPQGYHGHVTTRTATAPVVTTHTIDQRRTAAAAAARRLGHVAIRQGNSYECARCGATAALLASGATAGALMTARCEVQS